MTKRNSGYANGVKAGRAKGLGSFSMLIHAYFQSPQYAALSPWAVKLLVDLLCQYRGSNNGDLCAAWEVMTPLGWTSKSQLGKALKELKSRGWIILTRQGGRRRASLYALTVFGIDPCDGKLDAGIKPEPTPLHFWKHPEYMPAPKRSQRGFGKTNSLPLGTGQCCPSVRVKSVGRVNVLPFGPGHIGAKP